MGGGVGVVRVGLFVTCVNVTIVINLSNVKDTCKIAVTNGTTVNTLGGGSDTFNGFLMLATLPNARKLCNFTNCFVFRAVFNVLAPRVATVRTSTILNTNVTLKLITLFSTVHRKRIYTGNVTTVKRNRGMFDGALVLTIFPRLCTVITLTTAFLVNDTLTWAGSLWGALGHFQRGIWIFSRGAWTFSRGAWIFFCTLGSHYGHLFILFYLCFLRGTLFFGGWYMLLRLHGGGDFGRLCNGEFVGPQLCLQDRLKDIRRNEEGLCYFICGNGCITGWLP